MGANLFELFVGATDSPEKTLLETPDGEIFSHARIFAMASQIAQALAAQGLAPGERILVQAEKSVLYVALYFAVLRAGGVFVPVNTAYTEAEVAYFISDARPVLVVRDLESLWQQARAFAPVETIVPRGADDLAAILYTSGTTGRSKGAMLTHGNLASNALALKDAWRFTRDDVLLHALPIYHTHGLFVAINTVMLAHAQMLFLPKFDMGQMLRLMPRASVMMGVPTFYVRLLETITREHAANIRVFISGSAPLLAETHRAWKERTGHDILERYGMTETNMNTSNPYDGLRLPGSVGFPLPGVELRIREGVIEVRGSNVFKGYWGAPEKTAAEFREDGFFITGDLGAVDHQGYVHILGRSKDLVISGGLNVYPKEIEDHILEIEGVADCAVIGVPHRDFGEAVVAVVVGTGLTEADVIARLSEGLAKFKQPKRVIFVDDLPRNAMAKVQKNVLRQTYGDLFQA